MNPILEKKYNELENSKKYECWYLVKQPTVFDKVCYLVSFLEEYKINNQGMNLQDFISKKINFMSVEKPNIEISNNYRALRVAAFFGLITMTSTKYEEAIITDTFYQIKERCDGEYENVNKYIDIIERQIEKMFISSEVDEENENIRQKFRLFPVMLLYKILLEIGRATGNYEISIDEYRYLVATTKIFQDFLDTLLLIKLFREDRTSTSFDKFREKFDNRLIQALKQLPSLEISRESIKLKSENVHAVAKKVFLFEENPDVFTTNNYLLFLGSTKSLFDLEDESTQENNQIDKLLSEEETRKKDGENVLFYGVPGSGKSHTIETQYGSERMTRVVFHPDYMSTDFVGQILPTVKQEEGSDEKLITYEFTPGPFTNVMEKAYKNPENMYYLVIEEINRGNAPAIFGEIFQLLDRDENGTSKYAVVNYPVARAMYGDEQKPIRIPSNLTILATMNTSDQNVFTLDTAFQRRWTMRMIINDIEKADHKDIKICDTDVTWKIFNEVINDRILNSNATLLSSEDKRLGAYFVTKADLKKEKDVENRFSEKVIKYLWDDAFKFSRDKMFETSFRSLEQVIQYFISHKGNERFDILNSEVKSLIFDKVKVQNSTLNNEIDLTNSSEEEEQLNE